MSDSGWGSRNSALDAEHKKLNQMMASMSAVVMNDSGLGLDTEAMSVLLERLRQHFQIEEAAAAADKESCAILKEDHARLLGLLGQVIASVSAGNRAEAKERLKSFNAEMKKHDAEIDVPLFRMMATEKDPLIS